MTPIA
jgi:hypothetical protein